MSVNQFEGVTTTEFDALPATRYLVVETSRMDDANDDGVITVPPGESREVVHWDQEGPLLLFALGANDRGGAEYRILLDGQQRVATVSPLGTVNQPFSFANVLGTPIQADSSITLEVYNGGDAEAPFAGRMHIGVMG